MRHELSEVGCASVPREALASLGDLRRRPGVLVTIDGDRAWLQWPEGDDAVLRRVMSLSGAELYVHRGRDWIRYGEHLPAFQVPVGRADFEPSPIARAVVPEPVRAERVVNAPPSPVSLRLVRDDHPRGARAMVCALGPLAEWAEMAPSASFRGLLAASAGDEALVVGVPLPVIEGSKRFWGERLLIPLGLSPEPRLGEAALRRALGVSDEEVLLFRGEGAETVPLSAFGPLSRAGLRLAGRASKGMLS